MMLTVQIVIGNVEVVRRNGSSHSRYHGYTTGAHNSEAAIGHANTSGKDDAFLRLIQIAVRKPASTAIPAANWGPPSRSSIANTGSLKRKLWT
jgi:hypothetical protein